MAETIYMVGESYLAYKEKSMKSIDIKNSTNVAQFIKSIWYDDISIIERFLSLNLNRANSIISYHWVSQGGLTGTVVDTRIIFKSAIESLASAIIIAHNHPSRKLDPSEADLILTDKIKQTSNIMDIQLLDHLIITKDSYFSFADGGVI